MTGLSAAMPSALWHRTLREVLGRHQGARLGEATVVSRQVHMSQIGSPEEVIVVTTADAGQVFYGRLAPGEVIHLDIHHAVAEVDHHRVAAALIQALGRLGATACTITAQDRGVGGDGTGPRETPTGSLFLDFFSLATATGGGRVTGTLEYCRKESLRVAHRNHVHLAGRIADAQLSLLLPMISAVESAILAQGVELRRVERVINRAGTSADRMDLSPYADEGDTLLRPEQSPGGNGQGGGAGGSTGSGQSGVRGGGLGGDSSPWAALDDERRLQAAVDLSRRLGSPDEARRILQEFSRESGWAAYPSGSSQAPFLIRQLEQDGLLRRELAGLRLTDAGREMAAYLERHLRDVKLRFRKLIRRMPVAAVKQGAKVSVTAPPPSPDVRYGPIRGTAPVAPGSWFGDLAVPETVRAAYTRTQLERIRSGCMTPAGLRLERRDVHVHLRSSDQPLYICLLIDASASMAGRRILAAKHLARHLLASTRDRIAVIGFQERDVHVYVQFTRDYAQLEEGLSHIQPMGLTPLAHGLSQSLELIRESRVRRPLLLLITDGIPTVARWSIDPLADALEAARRVGEGKIPFGCIGLQPSRRYLEELTRAAGGSLHVVEELAEDALVTIAHTERQKLTAGARRSS
ncbi:MAG: vWA domain-containing protein [Mycobacterium leprae]